MKFISARSRVLLAVAAVVAAGTPFIAGSPSASAADTTTVLVPAAVCADPAPGHVSCDAMRLVRQKVSAATAADRRATSARASGNYALGPAGGYTPGDVASAYGVSPGAASASKMVVAIVDAYNDPNVLTDLNTFDTHYGLPAETSSTFRVVNGAGAVSPLPGNSTSWATEIALDVQTVRGLCHGCKILLVEGTDNSFASLSTAEDSAAAYSWIAGSSTLKTAVISNSYGGSEADPSVPADMASHYNHPGVVVLASTGDDGWYDWDRLNRNIATGGASNVPVSFNTVVGVGGTTLHLNADGTRAGEEVWNSNGPFDYYGNQLGKSLGASGSGCSTTQTAQPWQSKMTGYAALGCTGTSRSETDIAAIADPYLGYDIVQTFGGPGWETIGGTSLASPVIAALWALAGGSHGVKYPALTLYGHARSTSTTQNDVTVGGAGACGTATTGACSSYFGQSPNAIGYGAADCAFSWTNHATVTGVGQCYAGKGYDGVSGVGTPKGLKPFAALPLTVKLAKPSGSKHTKPVTTSAKATDPYPGGTISTYSWSWGDGKSTSGTKASGSHAYAKKGTYTITLTVKDSYGITGKASAKVTVK